MQKGLTPILIVLLIVLGIGGYFVYTNNYSNLSRVMSRDNRTETIPTSQEASKSTPTPTTDPTANWGIYTNSQLDFSFKHPNNWKVNTFQNNGDYSRGFTLVNEKDQEILTMYDSPPPNWIGCEDFPERVDKTIQIGKEFVVAIFIDNGKVVNICKAIQVTTRSGKKFNMEAKYFNSVSLLIAPEVLKTIKDLTIIQPSKNPVTYTNEYFSLTYPSNWSALDVNRPALSSTNFYDSKIYQGFYVDVKNVKIDIPVSPAPLKTESIIIDGINGEVGFYDQETAKDLIRHEMLILLSKDNLYYYILAYHEGNKSFDDFEKIKQLITAINFLK